MQGKPQPLTKEQIDFAQMCMERYISIRCDEGHGLPSAPDAGHSALLRWLLKGNEPFDKPPPLRFSYPCYALASGEKVMLMDAPHDARGVTLDEQKYTICIEQHIGYKWIEKLPRKTGVLEHHSGRIFEVTIGQHAYKKCDGTKVTEERYFMQMVREAGAGQQQTLPALTTVPEPA